MSCHRVFFIGKWRKKTEKKHKWFEKPLKNGCGNWSALFWMFFLESIRRDKATKKHFFFFVYWYFGWASKEMKKKLCTLKYLNGWTATAQGHTHKPKSIHAKHPQKRNAFPHTKHWIQLWAEKIVFSCFICFSSKNNNNNSEHQHNCVFFFQWNKIRFYSLNECGIFCFIVPSGFAFWLYSVVGLFSVCCKPSRSCNVSEEFVYYYVCVFWVSRSSENSLGLTHIGQAPEKDQTYNAQAHAYEWRSNKMDRHTDKWEYRKRRYDQAVIKVSVAQIKLYYLKMRKECKGSCIQLVLVLWSSKSFFRLFREFGWINGCSAKESPTKCRFWRMETTLSDKANKVIALHMARFIQISSENCVFGSKQVRIHWFTVK